MYLFKGQCTLINIFVNVPVLHTATDNNSITWCQKTGSIKTLKHITIHPFIETTMGYRTATIIHSSRQTCIQIKYYQRCWHFWLLKSQSLRRWVNVWWEVQFLISTGNGFHNLYVHTEKHNWPKELDLRGTTQSPLKADLVVLLLHCFCCIKVQSGGGALPLIILKMRHASVCFKIFSQLSKLYLSRM